MKLRLGCVFVVFLSVVLSMAAQTSGSSAASAQVPPVIQFSNVATGEAGNPLSGTVEITFSLYTDSQGGEPLWSETQSVTLDNSGQYSVYVGITKPNGVPVSLFTTGQAHWLGVQIAGQVEQPRVFLVSVPYAMKAGDAATVGGLSPSAFVMANPTASNSKAGSVQAPDSAHSSGTKAKPENETQNYIPVFIDGSGDLGNSILYQSGTTEVGIGTTTPAATLEVNGTAKFDGLASFASGQTFPGTLTGVTAGTGISVTGSKTDPTIGINTTFANEYYPQLNAANTFTKSQTVNGTMTATSFSGNGSGLTNVTATNSNELGGLAASAFPQLAANNTFSGQQTVNNTTIMTGNNVSGVLQVTNTQTSGSGPAIFGTTDSSGDYGVTGVVAATTGTTAGVLGETSSGFGYGVLGASSNVGVYGAASGVSRTGTISGTLTGVWGDTGGTSGFFSGVLGTADDNSAGVFENNSDDYSTLRLENAGSGGTLLVTEGQSGKCRIDTSGDLSCTGTMTSVVGADNGARKVSLYAVQSPENWFEDFGSGTLVDGAATVALDPTFAQTVNTTTDYHVFLTPNGDCRGLYVSQKSAASFEVRELGGGRSSVTFDYRIVAKRSGFEKVRLADVTEQYQKMERQEQLRRERMEQRRAARSSAGPIAAAVTPQHK